MLFPCITALPTIDALCTQKNQTKGACGPCPAGFLREREWAWPWPHAGTRLRHGRPALSTIVDPTKLNYLAMMTAASTVLAKSVRFLEHVSPGCCAGIARVSCRYPGPRESVHIKLLVSPVSFSHNNVCLLMVYRPYANFAYRATCRFRD